MSNLEYKRKLAAAFAELEAAEIPRRKYDPLYCRILRRLGFPIRTPYYMRLWWVPIAEASGSFFETVSMFVIIHIISAIIFVWPYEREIIPTIILNLSEFFFNDWMIYILFGGAIILGCIAIFSISEARRKHQLSRWEDL